MPNIGIAQHSRRIRMDQTHGLPSGPSTTPFGSGLGTACSVSFFSVVSTGPGAIFPPQAGCVVGCHVVCRDDDFKARGGLIDRPCRASGLTCRGIPSSRLRDLHRARLKFPDRKQYLSSCPCYQDKLGDVLVEPGIAWYLLCIEMAAASFTIFTSLFLS
jgi:hypothetical protein